MRNERQTAQAGGACGVTAASILISEPDTFRAERSTDGDFDKALNNEGSVLGGSRRR